MKVGDKYIYRGDGATAKDPWFVEIVNISNLQVAYIWTTKSCNFDYLRAQSSFVKSFLEDFEKAKQEGAE